MAELTSLVIYDSVLFEVGHHVSRWANSVERGFVMHAVNEAPMRSGELRSGIHGESFRSGVKHWEVHIHSDAEHSLYVLRGTTGPIMSNRMWNFRERFPYVPGGLPRVGRVPIIRNGATVGFKPDLKALHAHGYALRVREGNGFEERFALSVSGQMANDFMGRAAQATARRHSSLRGFGAAFTY